MVSAGFLCLSFFIVAIFFEETVKFQPTSPNSDPMEEESSDGLDEHFNDAQKPLPLRSALTRPVMISIANYAMVTLLEAASLALFPLIWSTSIEFGGLNFSPASIGLWLSLYGCVDGIFQFAVSPHIFERFGAGYTFMASIAVCAVVYTMFPFENLVLRHSVGGPNVTLLLLIVLQLSLFSINKMGFSAIYIIISSAVPNKRSLGAANGFGQTVNSVLSMVGETSANWLFAFSITNDVLGGNFVYVVLLVPVCLGLWIAMRLPRHRWVHGR